MKRRVVVTRRNAHQADDGKAERVAGERDEGVETGRQDTALLRLLPGIDLDEKRHPASRFRHRGGELARELCAVERLDDIKKRHRVLGLVRLQMADEMKLEIGMGAAQMRPFLLRLLDPVLAEDAVSGGQGGVNARRALLFRDGDDAGAGRRQSRLAPRAQDARFDGGEISCHLLEDRRIDAVVHLSLPARRVRRKLP